MLRQHLGGLSDLGSKKNIVSMILVGNAFVWYYTVLNLLQSSGANVWVWAPPHFSGLIVSAFSGALLANKMERSKFLGLWMITGVVSSLLLLAWSNTSVVVVSLVSLFLGISLGFGMPACMSYFADAVSIESRGRISGITMLASGIGMVAFTFALASDWLLIGIILGVWRLSSLFVFVWAKDYRNTSQKESISSFKQVVSKHSFALYFVPWVMFSLVNYLAAPSYEEYEGIATILGIVQMVSMGGSALLGGIFSDSVGRKRVAIAGFVVLGLSAAVLGFSDMIPDPLTYQVLYFNAAMNGVAMGFLLLLFVMTLWGDLSHYSSSDKYYALGVMPFFLSKFLQLMVASRIPLNIESSAPLFSFAAFFLFLAVLPLVYAPETLPEKTMKERELKFYVEKAQEIAQKHY